MSKHSLTSRKLDNNWFVYYDKSNTSFFFEFIKTIDSKVCYSFNINCELIFGYNTIDKTADLIEVIIYSYDFVYDIKPYLPIIKRYFGIDRIQVESH